MSTSTSTKKETAHVLVVDDDEKSRKEAERIAPNVPYTVTFVESAESALELLGKQDLGQIIPKIDMVITKYDMQGMTGYELLKKIKESHTLKNTKVVFLFDSCDVKEIRSYYKEDDVDAKIEMPLTAEELINICDLILGTKRRLTSE